MYFAEPWHMVTELIVRSKAEYDTADKWTGGSPYEQVFQHEDAVIALYHIPPNTRFPHVSGFFSNGLSRRETDASGWIFAQGSDALIAYYPLAPYIWRRDDDDTMRLHSPHLKNGAVVQVAPVSAYGSFDAFKTAILALPPIGKARDAQLLFIGDNGELVGIDLQESNGGLLVGRLLGSLFRTPRREGKDNRDAQDGAINLDFSSDHSSLRR